MAIASDLFRTITVKINDISQQLPYIVVNQADDNGKIIRFVPLDHGQKVTGFTGARLYYPPRSDNTYGDYVTGVESDGAWDFTIPVGVLNVGRVGCNLAFIDEDGETYSRNVVFLVEPAVSGVYDPGDGQQTRLDKVIGTVQTAADTAIGTINETADNAVENINQTASDAVKSIGKAEESISESVTAAQGSAEAAANSAHRRPLPPARLKRVNGTPPIVPRKPRSPPQRRSKARITRQRAHVTPHRANVTPHRAPNRRLILSRPFPVPSLKPKTPRSRLRNPLRLRLVVRVLPVGALKPLRIVRARPERARLPRRFRKRMPRPRLPPRRFPRRMRPLRPLLRNRPWKASVWRSVRRPRAIRVRMPLLPFRRPAPSIRRASRYRGATRENRDRLNMTTR